MKIEYPIRINKYLALKNYSTRIGADELIKKGKVLINGKKATLGQKVESEKDIIEVNMKKGQEKHFYFAYNKPIGIVTSSPQKGEKDILQTSQFPAVVFAVGRLDKDSRGLIILTNDGRITDKLLNPEYFHEKEYSVKVNKPISDGFLRKLADGIQIGDYKTKKCAIRRIGKDSFAITLTEGKKRQIRRMCAAIGFTVIDLKRTRVMNINLGKLAEKKFRKIEGQELERFLKSLAL